MKDRTSLSEAQPQLARALDLRHKFNVSLIESLHYLLDACVEVIPSDLFIKATKNLNSLDPCLKLSSFLSVIHTDFYDSVQKEDITKVIKAVHKLATDTFQAHGIKFICLENLDTYYIPLLKDIYRQEIPEDVEYYSLSTLEFEQMKKNFNQGLKIIERSLSDYFQELECYLSEILFVKASRIKYGSSVNAFGMFYKCYFSKWEKITDIIDVCIHELSHLHIFLLNKDDPIVLNGTELHDSPLRTDKRPLIGIYHAVFVLARVRDVLKRSLAINEIPDNEKDYCKHLIEDYKDRFHMGMIILNTHAKTTPLGQAILASITKLVDDSYAASSVEDVMPRAVR